MDKWKKLKIVKSSNIASAHYDKKTKQLKLEFQSGRTYIYYDVPEKSSVHLENAKSSGKWVNEFKKKGYKYAEV
jgi:hypothetical protein